MTQTEILGIKIYNDWNENFSCWIKEPIKQRKIIIIIKV